MAWVKESKQPAYIINYFNVRKYGKKKEIQNFKLQTGIKKSTEIKHILKEGHDKHLSKAEALNTLDKITSVIFRGYT